MSECNRWLARDEDDNQTERELEAFELPPVKKEKEMRHQNKDSFREEPPQFDDFRSDRPKRLKDDFGERELPRKQKSNQFGNFLRFFAHNYK